MKVKEEAYDVGVIVARFQVPELHEAHRDLIRHVCEAHEKTLVFLGLSPLLNTRENPLDFEARKQMLLEAFPEVNVLFIRDVNSDHLWSRSLDGMIRSLLTPSQSAVLYGGRDSFVGRYDGGFPTRELEPEVWVSGTEIRRKVSKRVKASADFRRGVVWAAYSRFPTSYPTVDIAIFNEDETKLLLGRKPEEPKFRFIGGFADPGSPTYEADAIREVREETGIEISAPTYIASTIIDDWRYRNEVDKIKTLLFRAKYLHGAPKPGDDIAEVKWVEVSMLREQDRTLHIMSSHLPLFALLAHDLDKRKSPRSR